MSVTCTPTWHPHPNVALDKAIENADGAGLSLLLTQPMIRADRYAQLRALDRLHQLHPEDPHVLASWVQAMLLSNRPAPVWQVAQHWSLASDTDPAMALIAAQVAQVMGCTDDARRRYREIVETYPEWIDAWQKYLEFESLDRIDSTHLSHIEALRARTQDPYVREKAAFALASHHSIRSPGLAFTLAREAHALKQARLGGWNHQLLRHRLENDQRWQSAPSTAGPSPEPIFVVGLPRSGTTLLTRMLSSHSMIAGLGEQNLIPALSETACRVPENADPRLSMFVQAWYRAATGDLAAGARAVVDKLPANVEHMGLILSMFPNARIIYLERELADTAISICLRDFDFGCRYTDTPQDLAKYAREIAAHARFWIDAAPGRIWSLRYEALVDDPQQTLAPILSSMNLPWESDMLDFWRQPEQIGTFSEAQVRRPLHRGSIGNWTRFLPEAGEYLRELKRGT